MAKEDINSKINGIPQDFIDYCKTGDKELIEKYTIDDLEFGLSVYGSDVSWYNAMERMHNILENKRTRKDKWIDRGITLFVGILTGIILMYVKNKYFPQ